MRAVRRAMGSVRARITLLATLVVGGVLVAASFGLLAVLNHELTQQGDAALRARAVELADLAVAGGLPLELLTVSDEGLVQVVDDSGRVLAASSNITGARPIAAPSTSAAGLRVVTLEAPDDNETETYRVWSTARDGPQGVVTAYVGTTRESVDEATRTLRRLLVLGVPLLLLVLAAGTWHVVGRALGRVERVRREVDGIGDDDLSRRLEAGPPDEVGRLVATLNEMLSRLEDGQRRERDFVADASHELQSPITAFRTQLEVSRAHPDGVDWERGVDDLIEDTVKMQRLVGDLLLLATTSQGLAAHEVVDLRALCADEAARASTGRIQVHVYPGDAVRVVGDPTQLARAVRNLLDNAVAHALSRVELVVERRGDHARLEVTDDGPGVAREHRDRLFDRFFRADSARSTPGTGLGLSIARSTIRAHGGDIALSDARRDGDGARFEVTLPAVR